MSCHERIHVVCTKFLLQDVHRFESLRLSDMSNRLSCDIQYIVNLLELMKEILSLNCYNYLFVNSCLISLGG
jgi:hypothetical protein